jgi:hypothetical protein
MLFGVSVVMGLTYVVLLQVVSITSKFLLVNNGMPSITGSNRSITGFGDTSQTEFTSIVCRLHIPLFGPSVRFTKD